MTEVGAFLLLYNIISESSHRNKVSEITFRMKISFKLLRNLRSEVDILGAKTDFWGLKRVVGVR
jgi:hypothetical protein